MDRIAAHNIICALHHRGPWGWSQDFFKTQHGRAETSLRESHGGASLMSALGQKQTSDYRLLMSAIHPKADIAVVAIGNNLGGWLWSDMDFLTIGEINGWRQNDLITVFDT
jgi:hypothetical protein